MGQKIRKRKPKPKSSVVVYPMQFYVRPCEIRNNLPFRASRIWFRLGKITLGPIPFRIENWKKEDESRFWSILVSLLFSVRKRDENVFFIVKPNDRFYLIDNVRFLLNNTGIFYLEYYWKKDSLMRFYRI